MTQTVIGVFEDSTDANKAVEDLVSNGFSRSHIDISKNDTGNQRVVTNADTHEEDSISRFFNNLFGNNDQSKYYSEVARRSSCLVTVHAQTREEAERAVDVLDEYGAVDIDERAAQYGYTGTSGAGYAGYDTENLGTSATIENDESRSIPIIEEELHVGKREVERGSARIRSRIVEKPVEESIRLRTEHINIERNPVNRPATEADLNHFQEGEINLTEKEEIPVVNKEARVVEEVKINKEVGERQESIHENVRSTEVDIENTDANEYRNRDRNMLDDDYPDTNRSL